MPDSEKGNAAVSPPEDSIELTYDLGKRSVRFSLDEGCYPRPVIYGAAYIFIDRCYVLLSRPADAEVGVQLKTKDGEPNAAELEALAGEFCNELLNQLLRYELSESTAEIRKYYMARAFFGMTGNPTIDALLMEIDNEEFDEDDLDIAVPWTDDKEPAAAEAGADAGGAAAAAPKGDDD